MRQFAVENPIGRYVSNSI